MPNIMNFENENVFQTIMTLYKKNFYLEIQVTIFFYFLEKLMKVLFKTL
jgi:hypothetical protein